MCVTFSSSTNISIFSTTTILANKNLVHGRFHSTTNKNTLQIAKLQCKGKVKYARFPSSIKKKACFQ
jgi:hypothetical protein